MDRRQFILAGAATASASTVMGLPAFTSGGFGGRIARPEIFKLRMSETDDRVAQAHRGLISARFAGGEVGGDVGSVLREADRCLD